MEDDNRPLLRYNDLNPDNRRVHTPEDDEADWSDYYLLGKSTLQKFVSDVGAATEYLTDGEYGGDTRRSWSQDADETNSYLTPAMRRSNEAKLLPGEGEQSYLEAGLGRTIAAKGFSGAVSLIPYVIGATAASFAAGAVGAGAAGGAIAGGLTARGMAGLQQTGDTASKIYEFIEKQSDEQLQADSEAYRDYRQQYDEKEARRRYMSDVTGLMPALTGVLSAALGGAESKVGARIGGAKAVGVKQGFKEGAKAEAKQEAVEGFTSEGGSQYQLITSGLMKQADWRKIVNDTLESGLIGGLVGGVTGAAANIRRSKGVTLLDDSSIPPDQAVALGGEQGSPLAAPAERQDTASPPLQPEQPTVPEKPETLQDQQDKLIQGEIPAMLFTEGDEELALPEGMERVETPDGIVHFDPQVYSADRILRLSKMGQINAVLGYVQSKDDVAAKQQQGIPAVAVTERGPDGTERRAAATSLDRVQDQAAAFQRQASPDSTVQTETAEDVLAGRQAPDDVAAALRRQQQADQATQDEEARRRQREEDYEDAWYDYQAEKRLLAERGLRPASEETTERGAWPKDYDEAWYEYQAEKRQASQQDVSTLAPKAARAVAVAKQKAAEPKESQRAERVRKLTGTVGRLFAAETALEGRDGAVVDANTRRQAILAARELLRSKVTAEELGQSNVGMVELDYVRAIAKEALPNEQPTLSLPLPPKAAAAVSKAKTPGKKAAAPRQSQVQLAANNYIKFGSANIEVQSDGIGWAPGNRQSWIFYADGKGPGTKRTGEANIRDMEKHGVPAALRPIFEDYANGRLTKDQLLERLRDLEAKVVTTQGKEGGALKPKRKSAKSKGKAELGKAEQVANKPQVNEARQKDDYGQGGLFNVGTQKAVAEQNQRAAENPQPERPQKVSSFYVNRIIAATDAERELNPETGKHYTKAELKEREAVAKAAEEAFYANKPAPTETKGSDLIDLMRRNSRPEEPSTYISTPEQALALRERLARMVAAVERVGAIPQKVYEGLNDYVAFARHAKDALTYVGKMGTENLRKTNDFVAEELAARNGDFVPMRKRRLEEGEQAKRQQQGDVEGVQANRTGDAARRLTDALSTPDAETVLEQADRAAVMERLLDEVRRQLDEFGEIRDFSMFKELEQAYGKKVASPADMEAALRSYIYEAPPEMQTYYRQYQDMVRNVFVEPRSGRIATEDADMLNLAEQGQDRLAANRISVDTYVNDAKKIGDNFVVSMNGKAARALRSSTVTQLLDGNANPTEGLAREISKLITRLAGDVQVHFLSDADYDRLNNTTSSGYWNGKYIVLRESVASDPTHASWLITHEAAHAALSDRIRGDAIAISQITAIAREVARLNPSIAGQYAFTDVHEFISEALSNKNFQVVLAQTPLTAPLAARLGILNQDWKGKSAWWGLVNKFMNVLGISSTKANFDALNGILSVVDRLGRDEAYDFKPGWSSVFNPENTREYARLTDQIAPSTRDTLNAPLSQNAYLQGLPNKVSDRAEVFKSWLSSAAVKGSTLDQLRQIYRGLFTDTNGDTLERLVSAIQRTAPYAQAKREKAEVLAQRFMEYAKKNQARAQKFADLALDATMNNVRLGDGVSNAHLNRGWSNWQGRALLPALQARFAQLNQEEKELYRDMVTFYRQTQDEITYGLIDNYLRDAKIEPKSRDGFIKRVMAGAMTAEDEKLLEGKDTAKMALKQATELRAVQGDYFPLMRQGNWVVLTEDDIKDTAGGKEIAPGKVEFRGRSREIAMRLAQDFAVDLARKQGLKVINVKPSPDTSTSTDFGVVVTVQRRGVYFFDSQTEAQAWRREHEGAFDRITGVQERDKAGFGSRDLTTDQYNTLLNSIKRGEGVPEEARQQLIDLFEQGAARLMAGNRVQQRSIARRNVQGASTDFGRNLVQYGQATGGYLAKIRYMPEIRDAMKEMRKQVDNRFGGEADLRNRVYQELNKRVNEGVISPVDPPRWMSDLMALTFLGKLFSPMYSVINGMQPLMVTYPVLAGRYGARRASTALISAYNALGFSDATMGGLRNTWKATKQFNATGLLDTSDIIGSMKKKLANEADGKQLVALIDELTERGAMSAGGFELAQALAEGRGAFGTRLSQVDRIARQLPQAIEDVNRAVTAIAAYRLAATAMSPEKARAYAFDTVMNTQGDYSAANAPRFFANPYLRPALQFKKYAQMMGYLLVDMAHKAFKGADASERAAARKAILNIFAVQIAMAGALSLPGLEIAKMAFMIAALFGAGNGWDDQEEKMQKWAEDTFGKPLGEMLTRGFTRAGGYGIDLSQRVSLADMFTFGEPKKWDKDHVQSYLWQMMTGAPGSTLQGIYEGMRSVTEGNVMKGIGQALPVKFVADALKSTAAYREGKNYGFEVAVNTFGTRTARQAEKGREVGQKIRERENLEDRYKKLQKSYLKAGNAGERAVVRAQIAEHNKTAPLRFKIFPNALDKVRERQAKERVN